VSHSRPCDGVRIAGLPKRFGWWSIGGEEFSRAWTLSFVRKADGKLASTKRGRSGATTRPQIPTAGPCASPATRVPRPRTSTSGSSTAPRLLRFGYFEPSIMSTALDGRMTDSKQVVAQLVETTSQAKSWSPCDPESC